MVSNFVKAFYIATIYLCIQGHIHGQLDQNFTISCEIHKVIPPLSISTFSANHANQIKDIYPHFNPNWIRSYHNVELKSTIDGKTMKANNIDQTLTSGQKHLLQHSDDGSPIHLTIKYIPENELPIHELKEIAITFKIDPEKDAEFPGGSMKLQDFLDDNILQHISKNNYKEHQLSAVKFTIDQNGILQNPLIVESSGDIKTDELMINTLCKMPTWIPAEYSSGKKTAQDFILAVGDMKSCTVNLLNIKQNHLDN